MRFFQEPFAVVLGLSCDCILKTLTTYNMNVTYKIWLTIHNMHRNSDIHRGFKHTPICGVGGVVFFHAHVTKWQSLQHVAKSTWRSFNCQASSSVLRTPTIPLDWRSARTCRWHAPQIHSKAWVRTLNFFLKRWLFSALRYRSFFDYLPFIVWDVSSILCHSP